MRARLLAAAAAHSRPAPPPRGILLGILLVVAARVGGGALGARLGSLGGGGGGGAMPGRPGRSAAHVAARAGDLDGLDAIFRIRPGGEGEGGGEGGAEHRSASSSSASSSALADEGDAHGVAALALAAWQGHVHVVDYLLRRGANPNRRDDYGVAAIHKAVGHGHLRCALRILGDGGADPNIRVGDVSDRVPAAYRAVSRHQTALHVACYRRAADGAREPGDARMVAALLRYGAEVDAADDDGDAAAHHAAAACDAPVTRLLVRAGANLRLRNARGDPRDARAQRREV